MQKYSKNASSGAINLGWHSFRLGFLKVLFLSCPHMQIPRVNKILLILKSSTFLFIEERNVLSDRVRIALILKTPWIFRIAFPSILIVFLLMITKLLINYLWSTHQD